jgi:glycerophosphoryl diester phosphodiesterase
MRRSWRYLIYIIILVATYLWLLISPAITGISSSTDNKVIVTGHRGAAGYAPENTLASVQKAIDLGVQRIEIDIQQTKDSVVVVLHDDRVDRTTNGIGNVADFTFEELQLLDAGSYFNSAFKNERIPSLEEVIRLVNGKTDLIIEFKYGNDVYPEIEENVIDLIEKYNALDWCIVHSFNTSILEKMHTKFPALRLHKLLIAQLRFSPFYYDTGLSLFDPVDYPYIEEYSINEYFANSAILNKLQSMGKKVNVWTVNKPKRIQGFKAMGIDGIISDYPDLILASPSE